MPIYEYECDKCGHAFEREQSMSDPPVKTCPKCRSRKVIKLISRSSFVLKGGGWYADGYSDAKKKSASANAEGKSDSSTESDSSSKSDTQASDSGKTQDKGKTKSSDKSSKGSSQSAA